MLCVLLKGSQSEPIKAIAAPSKNGDLVDHRGSLDKGGRLTLNPVGQTPQRRGSGNVVDLKSILEDGDHD